MSVSSSTDLWVGIVTKTDEIFGNLFYPMVFIVLISFALLLLGLFARYWVNVVRKL